MEITITFSDGSTYSALWVTPLGDNLYRAEESAMSMGESEQIIRYADVIEIELTSEREGRFLRVVQPSTLETSMHIVSLGLESTPGFEEFSKRVFKLGGYWELVFGGMLIVHLPHGTDFDLERELGQLSRPSEVHAQTQMDGGSHGTRSFSATAPLQKPKSN